jgi:hypothetical protein
MRRWLCVILALIVQCQLAWGAAAGYCEHESESITTHHFGHHEHQCVAGDARAATDPADATRAAPHLDCESCHLAGSMVLPAVEQAIVLMPRLLAHDDAPLMFRTRGVDVPERPDRTASATTARFGAGAEETRLPT